MSDTLPSAVAPSLREWARKALLWLDGEDIAGAEMETADGRSLDLALEGYALFGIEPGDRAALAQPTAAPADWRPISEAPPQDRPFDAFVEGEVRVVCWGKTSHVPIYGFCLADQGAEEFDLCAFTWWRERPAPPATQEEGR